MSIRRTSSLNDFIPHNEETELPSNNALGKICAFCYSTLGKDTFCSLYFLNISNFKRKSIEYFANKHIVYTILNILS